MLRNRILVSSLALLLCLAAVDAYGKATHFELGMFPQPMLSAPGGLEPEASGRAIFNLAKGAGKTIVQLNCKDLTPDVEYTVFVYYSARWHKVGTFVAKQNGSGTLHLDIPTDLTSTVTVGINKIVNGHTKTVLMSFPWPP